MQVGGPGRPCRYYRSGHPEPVALRAEVGDSIVVHATNQKQGKKLPDEFVSTGVSFLPVATK